MPAAKKVSREEMIDAAVDLLRESGAGKASVPLALSGRGTVRSVSG